MLKEMFGSEEEGSFEKKAPVLLAKGRYKSSAELILSGYKTFQIRYVIKSLIAKLLLVILALSSSVMMLMTSEEPMVPAMLIVISVIIGVYFITEPINNRKKLKGGLSNIEGTEYEVEITDKTVKISTVEFPEDEAERQQSGDDAAGEKETAKPEEENKDKDEDGEAPEDEGPPATIIHLDSHIVDFIDREDMFIICVKKYYVFIIPKSAFTEEEVQATREKLAAILGVRFKIAD